MADAPKYATGGIISSRDSDDVPIFREPGYIISAAMARRYVLASLDRLNGKDESPDHCEVEFI